MLQRLRFLGGVSSADNNSCDRACLLRERLQVNFASMLLAQACLGPRHLHTGYEICIEAKLPTCHRSSGSSDPSGKCYPPSHLPPSRTDSIHRACSSHISRFHVASPLDFYAVFNLTDKLVFDPVKLVDCMAGRDPGCMFFPCIQIPYINVPSNALKLLIGHCVTKGAPSPSRHS